MRQGRGFSLQLTGCDLPGLDITQQEQIDRMVAEIRPGLVINAAAYTRVDRAESESAPAFQVNRDGSGNLAHACAKSGIPLIHISTDYVFDGEKGSGYLESDTVSPLGVYGHSKAEGEELVRDRVKEHIILRTSWLYGVYGHNFVKTMLRLGREKQTLPVVSDQFGSPTSASDLAETALTIARRCFQKLPVAWGTYHFCNQGVTTWYLFAREIFDVAADLGMRQRPEVNPISTDRYPTKARRPMYSALDCGRIKTHFNIHPKPWQESLKITIERIFDENLDGV